MIKSLRNVAIIACMSSLALAVSDCNQAYVYDVWYNIGESSISPYNVQRSNKSGSMEQSNTHKSNIDDHKDGSNNSDSILRGGNNKKGIDRIIKGTTIKNNRSTNSTQIYQQAFGKDFDSSINEARRLKNGLKSILFNSGVTNSNDNPWLRSCFLPQPVPFNDYAPTLLFIS